MGVQVFGDDALGERSGVGVERGVVGMGEDVLEGGVERVGRHGGGMGMVVGVVFGGVDESDWGCKRCEREMGEFHGTRNGLG